MNEACFLVLNDSKESTSEKFTNEHSYSMQPNELLRNTPDKLQNTAGRQWALGNKRDDSRDGRNKRMEAQYDVKRA